MEAVHEPDALQFGHSALTAALDFFSFLFGFFFLAFLFLFFFLPLCVWERWCVLLLLWAWGVRVSMGFSPVSSPPAPPGESG